MFSTHANLQLWALLNQLILPMPIIFLETQDLPIDGQNKEINLILLEITTAQWIANQLFQFSMPMVMNFQWTPKHYYSNQKN